MHSPDLDAVRASTEQEALSFVLMRGGTSKAVFLRGKDLPRPGWQGIA